MDEGPTKMGGFRDVARLHSSGSMGLFGMRLAVLLDTLQISAGMGLEFRFFEPL